MQPPITVTDRFLVDPAHPLPGAGGGLPAFAATDQRGVLGGLMAVAVNRSEPARANLLRDLTEPVENLLHPIAAGAGYVICPAPVGSALSESTQPWPEAALMAQVLRPVAQVLRRLEIRRLTHRAIRPNNVFLPGPGHAIVLGCGWAAPPALHQPPAFEPFYSLMCHPAGRGDGTIADDVYALGCLLITLATGAPPLAGLDNAAVLRRKLEHGSYAALAGEQRLSALISDLARGMLAEDPDHRPTPSMLLDPATARGRRVATRPPRRAPRALVIGSTTAWDARTLAHAIAKDPESGVRSLRDGGVTQWLRRGLGDSSLYTRMEELVRQRTAEPQEDEALADSMLAMRVVATIEPLAPLCWCGIAVWPDGLGPLLAAAHDHDPDLLSPLEALISAEGSGAWASCRERHADVFALRAEARANRSLMRIRAPAGGISRLTYTLNPLLPCRGALGSKYWVGSLDTLMPAMDMLVQAGGQPCDPEVIAFLAAHASRDLDMEVNALAAHHGPTFAAMPWLRILAYLQSRYTPRPLPALTRWIAAQADALTARWNNRERRTALRERLQALADEGIFAPIVAMLDDPVSHDKDTSATQIAAAKVVRINAELAQIAHGGDERAALAVRYGQEIVVGLGLTALAVALAVTAIN